MPTNHLAPNTARVRMYHVGFGDCFLFSFNRGSSDRHILIDCGVHARGQLSDVPMSKVVTAIGEATGKKLSLVIATHRHQDHIAGFGLPAFAEFEVGDVWMPWTEDPKDEQANKLRGNHSALAQTLAKAHLTGAAKNAIANLELAGNNAAMTMLRSGFQGHPQVKYLRAGDDPVVAEELAGLKVQVLGPPMDPSFLAKMDPPAGHHYLARSGALDESARIKPLRESKKIGHWTLQQEELAREIDRELRSSEDELALTLDNVVNNTSLVLLFSIGAKNFLFPGDAQWGNWKSWLEKNGRDVLQKICFYKVSHHGSMNATPTDAVEAMPLGGFVAMASTQQTPFPSVPKKELIDALRNRTNQMFVESDQPEKIPDGSNSGFVKPGADEFWIDYEVKLDAATDAQNRVDA